MSEHVTIKCKKCDIVIISCRCIESHKNVQYDICGKCRSKGLEVGDTIQTMPNLPDAQPDYSDWAKQHRKPGAKGKIQKISDSHGLCYVVEHDDGTVAAYEPEEIFLV